MSSQAAMPSQDAMSSQAGLRVPAHRIPVTGLPLSILPSRTPRIWLAFARLASGLLARLWGNRWVLSAAILLASSARVWAGPTVLVGRDVNSRDRVPVTELKHVSWNALLAKYVDRSGMVNYAGWKQSSQDVALLDSYIAQLSTATFANRSAKAEYRDAEMAFWINAYNAVTIKGILREYPTSSIRNHTAKLIGYNIWKDLKLQVDGLQVSLDSIEHQYLRKMGEPRIHFAIVCASIGCPRLLDEAYTAERLDEQLTLNARAFFADSTKLNFDAKSGVVALSPILSWFATDFGRTQAEQLRTITPLVPKEVATAFKAGKIRLKFLAYDWDLNEQK